MVPEIRKFPMKIMKLPAVMMRIRNLAVMTTETMD